MRVTLDNRKSYDLLAMFKPVKLNRTEAWLNFRANLNAWPNALKIPFQGRVTFNGFYNWLLVLVCHWISLLLLPLLCCFGYSMHAYSFYTQSDAEKMKQYEQDLKRIYAELSVIEDKDEYQIRLKEEIAKVKPF
tara:strand:- start:5487 stop:5888 length:402 start_codon:yes stop_codon:yes gene_type:complete